MVSVGLLLFFGCQVTTVLSEGIILPVASLSSKCSPIEQSKLTLSFTPNNDLLTCCTPASCQSIDRSSQTNLPFFTRPTDVTPIVCPGCAVEEPYIQTPLLNPTLDNSPQLYIPEAQAQAQSVATNYKLPQTNENAIQNLNPTLYQAPQVSSLPQINLENSLANSNTVRNDCVRSAPPVAVPACSYFIVNNDASAGVTKTPLIPMKLDSLPSNIYRIKVNDAQPIFIDCSKSNCYTSPPPKITPIHIKDELLNKVDCNPIEAKDNFIPPEISILNEIEENSLPINPIIPNCSQNKVSLLTNNEEIATEKCANKVVYPISNVVFNYGQNIGQKQPESMDKNSCSSSMSNIAAIDNNIGLSITPVVNIVPNTAQYSQYVSPSDDRNIDMNLKTLVDPVFSLGLSSKSLATNEADLYMSEFMQPISQLPNVNVNARSSPPPCNPTTYTPKAYANSIQPIQSCVYSSPNIQPVYKSTSDSFSSRLSSSLNSIISLLTTGLISTLLGKTCHLSNLDNNENPRVEPLDLLSNDINNHRDCEYNRDIRTPQTNEFLSCSSTSAPYYPTDPFAFLPLPPIISAASLPLSKIETPKESLLPSPLPSTDLPAILSCPQIQTSSYFFQDDSITSPSCTKKSVNPKPYLSSITINLVPTESSNDVIIVL